MAVNRILVSVNAIDDVLADSTKPQSELDALHREMDVALDEFCRWQEIKSLAVTEGVLTPEEGAYIYHQMGELPQTFNKRPLAVKVAITKTMAELFGVRV
jgi:hypothetical protein